MSQPFIKFISHTTSYMIFIGLIIGQILRIEYNGTKTEMFKTKFPQHAEIFSKYVLNESLQFRFYNENFAFRSRVFSFLDYICSLWIIGYYFFIYY